MEGLILGWAVKKEVSKVVLFCVIWKTKKVVLFEKLTPEMRGRIWKILFALSLNIFSG